MKAYLFPGQGSQRVGMGGDLFEEYVDLADLASDILGYSIRRLCLEDPDRRLSNPADTQPALFVVNVLSYLRRLRDDPAPPAYVAGHSLGELCALYAAGVFDFEIGVRLVKARGQLMSRMNGGGMAMILGLDAETILAVLRQEGRETLDVANYNSPSQTVLAGPREDIEAARFSFSGPGVHYLPLNVSAAFHSRYMAPAVGPFELELLTHAYSPPRIPVLANVTARPYARGDVVSNLRDQLCGSVRWSDCIGYLRAQGVTDFEELGPGEVLTKLLPQIPAASVAAA